ncbi:MAG: hypothetical protein J7M24_05740, partial [Candidatus Latescibacteria bacterium]|nr:hypothetical protein [Candidatus Latescibacterota bacterium]
LKGRGNYICLHRWQRLVNKPDRYLTKQARDLMLPVASWLLKTATGDLSETGFYSMLIESGLLERINSDTISCIGGRCPSNERCFVNRVRRAAQKAHVIIVNHSLVFSDMVSEGGVLGQYSRLVFDEAHNIEKVALQYLGVSMHYYRIRRVSNRLFTADGNGFGIFAMLREWLNEMRKGFEEFAEKGETVGLAIDMVTNLRAVARTMFESLFSAVREESSKRSGGINGKLRYDDATPVFGRCSGEIEDFFDSVSGLIQLMEKIKLILTGVTANQLRDRDDILHDLEKSQIDLQSIVDELEFLIAAGGRNVFWFEFKPSGSAYSMTVMSAPLDVAEKLAAGLYDHMETVVMTSATLTVARDFSYIRERLGLNLDMRDRVREFIAASPFDYDRQSRIIVPTYLPSPKNRDYIDTINETLFALARETRRGMLVLFTSRSHLNRSYHELSDSFMHSALTLMAQGIDGSRNLLLRKFREETGSVLFGTDSFWEGVDVPGKALEIVVIVRLPFAVPTEPIVQAQMEEIERAGGNPFLEFSVPEAAIRLRQGAGRLIRHRNDRGIVVVLDNRIITARYGGIFRRCLPGRMVKTASIGQFVETVHAWFGGS